MSNETVTYSLESVLTRIESKIDSLEKRMDEKIDSLEKRMGERFDKVDERFEKVDERFDKVDERFDKVDDRLTKVEIGQAELKAELKGDIKVLDEKIEGLKGELKGDIKVLDEKIEGLTVRVAYQEFTNRGILIALVVAVLGGAAKLFGFFPNP
jgi:chromosome segregation ATPase